MTNYKTEMGNYKPEAGSSTQTTLIQALDLSITDSTTFVNTDLVSPTLKVGKSYHIVGYFNINAHATPDAKLIHNFTSLVADLTGWNVDDDALEFPFLQTMPTQAATIGGLGADEISKYVAVIINVTTAGTFALQFAQANSNANPSKFRKGSYMIIQEI